MSVYGGDAYGGETYAGAGAAAAPAATDEIEFLLYNETNSTFLGKLDQTWGRQWSDPHNDAGGGQFEIAADNPVAVSELTDANGEAVYHNIVRCRLQGTDRFAFVVRENRKGTAKAGEEVDDVLSISGPGTLAYFQRSLVYPERGIGRASPDDRLFNWTSKDYDDTAWAASTEVKRQDQVVTLNSWNLLPSPWADPLAYWIWDSSGQVAGNVPAGDCYFRRSFTLATPVTAVLLFTADDGMELYLDNARIAQKDMERGHSWGTTARIDLNLDDGPHLFAAKATNIEPQFLLPGVLNMAGLILALHSNAFGTSGGTDFGTVLLRTDSSWKVLGYPPGGPPGMTTGEILRLLFTEAQARGSLPGVTWTFTDALDSAGNAWTTIPDFGVSVGTSYYAVLRMLAELSCDLHMDPSSLRLDVFNQRGSASSVVLAVASNVTDLEHQGTGDVANAALLRHRDGWTEVTSASSIATGGRFESFLSLGTAPSPEQGALAASALFAEHANPQDAVVVTHEGRPGSGEEPYADYDVGDTITVPARDLSARAKIVRAITVSEDPEGFPIYTPEIAALSEVLAERQTRWLKRMSMGTNAGTSENASPYVSAGSTLDKALAAPDAAVLRYATLVVAASNSLNPEDADYVCTGTNDHVTIKAALDALPVTVGGRVLLMEGTFNIAGQIAGSSTRPFVLQGQGTARTVLNVTANITGDVLNTTNNADVRDLTIDVNGFSLTDNVLDLQASGMVENVLIREAALASNSKHAFALVNYVVVNCTALNITGSAFRVDEVARVEGSSCDFVSGHGLDAGQIEVGAVIGNIFRRCTEYGMAVQIAIGACVGNDVEASGGNALRASGGVFYANSLGTSGAAHTVLVTAPSHLESNGVSCGTNHGASFDGINLSAAADESMVLANTIIGTSGSSARTGIRLETGCDNCAVLGNVMRNVTASITDNGTGNQLAYSGGALGDNLSY